MARAKKDNQEVVAEVAQTTTEEVKVPVKGLYPKLLAVQTELKAPKAQRNNFGNYNYRSCEDILEAAKPILNSVGALVFIKDELKLIGTRYYIEATVTFVDTETGESMTVNALAREEESKKGMDGSQITGTASSYARKYALNGLFCIDDTKDSDTNENKTQRDNKAAHDSKNNKGKTEPTFNKVTDNQRKRMWAFCKGNKDLLAEVLGLYGYSSSSDVTTEFYEAICEDIQARAK